MNKNDQAVLRGLAARWMELASLAVMAQRRRLWVALNGLHPERPMVLFETDFLENYIAESELQCTDPYLRDVERRMRWHLRHAEEVGDDVVVEPFFRLYWEVDWPDYGVPLLISHAVDVQGGQVAYVYEHPIKIPADVDRLTPRTWHVNRESTKRHYQQLCDAFGDILPVVLHGTGALHSGLTQDLFKLIGNDNLMAWVYDAPEALHRLMAYLRDDRITYYTWMEHEGLLGLNSTGWELVGSGSPGYTTELPHPDGEGRGRVRLRDLWVWMESQETTMISPRVFGEIFLPYMAEVCRLFGLVYYGCCEPVHDRWDLIRQAIPNVRGVSVSPWCNQYEIGQKLGRAYVYSRKPKAAPISGPAPDWDVLRADMEETLAAARDCNLEFIYRDVYRIGDRERLRTWTQMVRAHIGGE